MKIVFLDTTLRGSVIGGAHTSLYTLIKGLVRDHFEVHLVTQGEPTAKTALGIDELGATVHRNSWNHGALVEDSAPVFSAWVNELLPDVFVISVSADMGWVVLPLLDPKIATLTIGHNDSETFYMPARHYARFLTRAVGVSKEICERYVTDCGIDRSRTDWIPYGVTAAETGPAETSSLVDQRAGGTGPLRLIYVGRLDEEQKRASDLISTARLLSERGIDYTLSILGDGELMGPVKERLAAEIATRRVALYGWVEGNKVIERLRESDVFLLTSNYEGFCISLMEAMANGCCPVVTDIRSGNKQLVRDGENGFVVPVGDVPAFVEKIICLANDRAQLLKFRQRAWETGRPYSVGRMVEAYEKCFAEAVRDARANPRTPDPDFPLMESCRSKYPLWLRRIKARAKSFSRA